MINRLKAIYFSRQVIDSFVFSFLSVILALYGFDDYQVGRLMGLAPIVMLISTPVFTLFDDGGKRQKCILLVCLSLTTVGTLLFLIPNISFLGMVFIIIAVSVVRSPLSPSIDGFTTVIASANGTTFSKIRVWASICYIFTMAAGGVMIDKWGFASVVIISCVFMVVATVLVATVPMPDIGKPSQKASADYKQLFTNKQFLMFLLITVTTWTVWSSSYNYDGSYFAVRWGDAAEYGFIEGIRVIFEVFAIVLINRMRRKVTIKFAYLSFGICSIAKFLLYYFNTPLWTLFAITPFIGAAFGAILAVYVDFIVANVRKHNIHIALFVLASCQMAFSALYTYAVSFVAETLSLQEVYLCYIALCVIGVIITFLFKLSSKPNPLIMEESSVENTQESKP